MSALTPRPSHPSHCSLASAHSLGASQPHTHRAVLALPRTSPSLCVATSVTAHSDGSSCKIHHFEYKIPRFKYKIHHFYSHLIFFLLLLLHFLLAHWFVPGWSVRCRVHFRLERFRSRPGCDGPCSRHIFPAKFIIFNTQFLVLIQNSSLFYSLPLRVTAGCLQNSSF